MTSWKKKLFLFVGHATFNYTFLFDDESCNAMTHLTKFRHESVCVHSGIFPCRVLFAVLIYHHHFNAKSLTYTWLYGHIIQSSSISFIFVAFNRWIYRSNAILNRHLVKGRNFCVKISSFFRFEPWSLSAHYTSYHLKRIWEHVGWL